MAGQIRAAVTRPIGVRVLPGSTVGSRNHRNITGSMHVVNLDVFMLKLANKAVNDKKQIFY